MYYNKQRALKLRNAQEVRVDWGKGNYIKNIQDKQAIIK